MRISDWSSDVCSSDLHVTVRNTGILVNLAANNKTGSFIKRDCVRLCRKRNVMPALSPAIGNGLFQDSLAHTSVTQILDNSHATNHATGKNAGEEIGRASCRARVCQ